MNDQHSAFSPIAPKIIAIIVDWDSVQKVKEIIDDHVYRSIYIMNGMGTCKSEFLDVLGVGTIEKAVIIYIQPTFQVGDTIKELTYRLELDRPGRGIAFTIPLSGISNPVSKLFNEENLFALAERFGPEKKEHIAEFIKQAKENPELLASKMERMKNKMDNELEKPQLHSAACKHDLILTVINKGYSDDVMDAAKEAGAAGGTIIQARRTGPAEAVKFFGITVQAEKEIVAILTTRESKKPIMKAINHECGISTAAGGIVFSVPVDSVAGLSGMDCVK